MGMYFLVGIQGTTGFFMKKSKKLAKFRQNFWLGFLGKIKYSGVFFVGFFVIVMRFGLIGGIIQLYSLFMLFRSFLPYVLEWMYQVPVLGPFLSKLKPVLIDFGVVGCVWLDFLENNYFTQRMSSQASGNQI